MRRERRARGARRKTEHPSRRKRRTSVQHLDALTLGLDQSVYCWGANNAGQLGIGRVSDFESAPQRVLWK